MGWEVYSSSGGEIYKTTYDNNKQTSSTEFLYGNPIDQSQQNYKIWKNSIADIQYQVDAFMSPSGGAADIQSPKDYRLDNKSTDEKIVDIVKNSPANNTNIVDEIIKEVPEVANKILGITAEELERRITQAPTTAQAMPTTPSYIPPVIPDSSVLAPNTVIQEEAANIAQMGGGDQITLPPEYQTVQMNPIGDSLEKITNVIKDKLFDKDEDKKDTPRVSGDSTVTSTPLDTLQPSAARQQFDAFSELGWRDIYQGYTNQLADIDTPDKYRWVIEQGLSNNPLLRTAQTQFLLQGDYNVLSNDPDLGGFHTSRVLQGYEDDRGDRNPYWEFLENYQPIQGRELIESIDNVIDNINAPAGSIVGTDVSPEDYSDNQRRQIMLRQRFGIGNQAGQAQSQLVALPILEHTSPALRNEIANVLSTLEQNWLVNPDRPKDENWLEYARRNNFFGMVPEDLLLPTIKDKGSITGPA